MKNKGLKRQGSLAVLAVIAVLAAAAVVVPRLWPQAVQACTEYTRAFAENFDTIDHKDAALSSVAHWPSGPITLAPLGSNFVVGSADKMGRRIYQCASGDLLVSKVNNAMGDCVWTPGLSGSLRICSARVCFPTPGSPTIASLTGWVAESRMGFRSTSVIFVQTDEISFKPATIPLIWRDN